jgi:hypothetical protein
MLHSEKLDFTRFYKCKNSQKRHFIFDLFSGEYVIIMLKGENVVVNRVSELPQSKKFEKLKELDRKNIKI